MDFNGSRNTVAQALEMRRVPSGASVRATPVASQAREKTPVASARKATPVVMSPRAASGASSVRGTSEVAGGEDVIEEVEPPEPKGKGRAVGSSASQPMNLDVEEEDEVEVDDTPAKAGRVTRGSRGKKGVVAKDPRPIWIVKPDLAASVTEVGGGELREPVCDWCVEHDAPCRVRPGAVACSLCLARKVKCYEGGRAIE